MKMNCESNACPSGKPVEGMQNEAESIAAKLNSRSVTAAREGLEQLRADLVNLSGPQLLQLQRELEISAAKHGLTNPLRRLPETESSRGYPRFTGDEFVVMTNPFSADDRVEAVRRTENTLPKDRPTMLYFNSQMNGMVDHLAVVAEANNKLILSRALSDAR